MTTAPIAHTDTIVLDYLGALWAETEDLAPELRDELITTVADYIAMRRTAGVDDPEVILGRLGPPEAVAGAARRGRMPAYLRPPVRPADSQAPPADHREYAGIALLTAGAVGLPVVAPLAGMLLVSASPRWTPVQKSAAWVLSGVPVLFAMLLVLGALAFRSLPALALAYLLVAAGPFVAGLSLLPGLSRRGAAR